MRSIFGPCWKPLQLAAKRVSRRTSKQFHLAAVPDDLSDDEAEVVLECTHYTQEEDSECGQSAVQKDDSDKEEEEGSEEEDEPASWPRMERSSFPPAEKLEWQCRILGTDFLAVMPAFRPLRAARRWPRALRVR